MSRLVSYVHVNGDGGQPHVFGPDDEVPEWAARKMGPHCFDGDHPYPDESRKSGTEPSRNGKGSSLDAWVAFAAENGHDVDPGTSRDQVIADLAILGVISE